jgi:molybdopterin converting factor small subunit
LFAAAREAAGTARDEFDAPTLDALLAAARGRYGPEFSAVLNRSRVWVNGEPAPPEQPLRPDDEVAVLPPVSGGAVETPTLPPPRVQSSEPGPAPPAVAPPEESRRVWAGMAWAVMTAVVSAAGAVALGVWMAGAAAVAAAQVVRARRTRKQRPVAGVTVGGAALIALGAAFGGWALAAVAGAVVLAAVVAGVAGRGSAWAGNPALTVVVSVAIGLAAAAPVLVRRFGLVEPLVLLASVWAYDAGAFVIGTGAQAAWEGIAAGAVSLVPVTVAAAVLLVPKFPTVAPLVLGVTVAVLAPFGPKVATVLAGDSRAEVPALLRLDSLVLAGPAWALLAWLLLR